MSYNIPIAFNEARKINQKNFNKIVFHFLKKKEETKNKKKPFTNDNFSYFLAREYLPKIIKKPNSFSRNNITFYNQLQKQLIKNYGRIKQINSKNAFYSNTKKPITAGSIVYKPKGLNKYFTNPEKNSNEKLRIVLKFSNNKKASLKPKTLNFNNNTVRLANEFRTRIRISENKINNLKQIKANLNAESNNIKKLLANEIKNLGLTLTPKKHVLPPLRSLGYQQ